ncbi:MAG: hypothetical protein KGN34_15525 [Sphingomonadales bacterium]|nr:hypothetical protein [Sphingomonadales bacterium]
MKVTEVPGSYSILYDIQSAGGIPAYSPNEIEAVLFAGGLVALVLIVIAIFSREHRKQQGWMSLLLVVGAGGYLLLDMLDRRGAARQLVRAQLTVAEGCVEGFLSNHGDAYPAKSDQPDEEWSIGNHRFGYKSPGNSPGYRLRESRGGVVHAGQYLRVSYLVSPIFKREEIMKIEQGEKPCQPRPGSAVKSIPQ